MKGINTFLVVLETNLIATTTIIDKAFVFDFISGADAIIVLTLTSTNLFLTREKLWQTRLTSYFLKRRKNIIAKIF